MGSVLALVSSCPLTIIASVVLRALDWGPVTINWVVTSTMVLPFALMLVAWLVGLSRAIAPRATLLADRSLSLDGSDKPAISATQWRYGVATNDGASVELEDHRGDRYTVLVGRAESASWLEKLGLDVRARRYEARIQRAFSQLVFWLGGFPVLLVGAISAGMSLSDWFVSDGAGRGLGVLFGAVITAVIALWTSLHWLGAKVVVGADGVRYRDGALSRFIAFDTVQSARARADGDVELTLTNGKTVVLWLGGDVGPSASVVSDRILEAWRASREAGSPVPAALLVRGQRTLAEWKAHLVALLADSGTYRTVSVQTADLVRVLRDVSAPIEQRIAAAIALSGQDTTREQVRVVIDSTANEQVRVALSAGVEGTLDEEQRERGLAGTGVRVSV